MNICDKQAEQNVLGALLLDDKIGYKLREIKREYFYYAAHQEIFSGMLEIINSNRPIDIVLLNDVLSKKELSNKIEISYLTSLTSVVATTSNIDYYIKILQEKYLLRELEKQTKDLLEEIRKGAPVNEITATIDSLKDTTINNDSVQSSYIDASTVKTDYSLHKNISTGFYKLDRAMDGFRYGTLTVLSGKPASGKSTVINQFIRTAIDNDEKAFLYSGELPCSTVMEWFRRTVVSREDIKQYQTYEGYQFDGPSEYAAELINEWVKDKFFIYSEDSIASEKDIVKVIEHLWIRKGVRMFIIDNLMTLALGDSKTDKYEAQKMFVRDLKNLARKYKLVIILVAHPKKNDIGANGFDMFDVAGASEIVNLCDYELAMYRKIKEEEDIDETKILLIKNRITGKQNKSLRLYYDEERKRLYSEKQELEKNYMYDTNKLYNQENINDMNDIAPF